MPYPGHFYSILSENANGERTLVTSLGSRDPRAHALTVPFRSPGEV
jgi:hypothetical protein